MKYAELLQYLGLGLIAIVGYFLRGIFSKVDKEFDKSRMNERELYKMVNDEKVDRLKMHIEILKDKNAK